MSRFLFLKRACLLVILLQIISNSVQAQQPYYNQRPEFLKANSVWAFGSRAGFDFNSGSPKPILTAINNHRNDREGAASVADPRTGKLLFYSDGGRVWNANHEVMPNGSKLLGNALYTSDTTYAASTVQGVCIVPFISDPDKYYLFSLSGASSGGPTPEGTLFYNVVDMSLNSGLGDIVSGQKNIALDFDYLSEGMIAVPGDNCDIWLILKRTTSHEFKAYHITKDGIDTVPVISNTSAGLNSYLMGVMAISPDRKKIALTTIDVSVLTGAGGVIIGEFNAATGAITNTLVVDNTKLAGYSACFSPDNSKLYIAELNAGSVYQFDLTTFNATAITNSLTNISSKRGRGHATFKLYNDTIYYGFNDFLDRINHPDLLGNACDYQDAVVNINDSALAGNTLNTDVVFPIIRDTLATLAWDSIICSVDFTLSAPQGFKMYKWEDGSTSMDRNITVPDTYWVSYIDYQECLFRIDTFIISGITPLIPPVINVDSRTLGTHASYHSYHWMKNGGPIPGATDSTYIVTENGDYQVAVSSETGCVDTSDVYEVTNIDEPNRMQNIDILATQIHVFPNPVKDMLHIIAPVDVSVKIYSTNGGLIQSTENAKKLNVAELSGGLYFLKIHDLKGRFIKTEKIIK